MPVCANCGQENPDGFRFCGACAAPLDAAVPARELRKTVSVVFCDLTGSTALGERTDPEALRALLARYFERMREIVERHGGSVEKFIGDAVMAIFGVPVAHEDDALRACRAAIEMRDVLPELGLAGRIGVNTGEVVTGTEERLATGDAVNVAARLEQAAQPGEVLLGAATLQLVRPAVELGEERLLDLKGKSAPVAAYPLLAVTRELERRFATAMVGRDRELRRLGDAFAQASHDGSCQLFTVLGSAGVGKSRLAAELLSELDARVVRGRCLSYGDGITYWPAVEILKQIGTLPAGDAARPLQSLLGETGVEASPDEIAWGFRKLLEEVAREQPLVCVFDDLHWAEETLLDLVEHVADLARDAPILLLCLARPELLERRPAWGGGKWNATTVLLEPLDARETAELLAELGGVSEELLGRIVQVAEGNPLFLEEMLALVRDSRGATVDVPPTIQALLAARLDQLDPVERAVLERGSIEGRTFHRGAVAALAEGDGQLDQRLVALVRKELVRPDRAMYAGDDAYRFRHLLIRDAAYEALPKATRAQLHERFAGWLGEHGTDLVELDEILGYHLEQAARYLAELGADNREVALAAGERLGAAGHRAVWRSDFRAGTNLLERSLALTRPHRLDVNLEVDLAQALQWGNATAAVEVARSAEERAAAAGDAAGAALARTLRRTTELHRAKCSATELEAAARDALVLLEAAGDDDGLVYVWVAMGASASMQCRFEDWTYAMEQALAHARRSGHAATGSLGLSVPLAFGPRRASDALSTLEALRSEHPLDQVLRGLLLVMLGEVEAGREIAAAAAERSRELGHDTVDIWLGELELLAGDAAAAAVHLRAACDVLEASGRTSELSTYAPMLGRALCALGRHDEAEPLAARGRELGDDGDVITQTNWRQAQALVLSARGLHAEAEEHARAAVELVLTTDILLTQGNAYCDLATVLDAAGRREDAVAALREALDRYERKEAVAPASRVRERLQGAAV